MGELTNTTTDKAPKKSWFKGLKSEFKKIVWPDKEALTKQSIVVIIVTIILGAIIYLVDLLIKNGITLILG